VRDDPRDAAALTQWATLLGWLNKYDESIAAWRRVLELKPGDPDASMGLARVQYWKGEYRPARAQLETVLQAQPANVDALVLCGDISLAAHDRSGARDCYRRAKAADPSNDAVDVKLARTEGPPARRVDAGGGLDSYSNFRGTEGMFFAQCSLQAAENFVASVGYEQLHQFGEVDHRVNGTGYLNVGDSLTFSGRFAWSPTAKTIAAWELTGGPEWRISQAFSTLLTIRHLDFTGNGVTIFSAGVRLNRGSASLLLQGGPTYSTVNPLTGFGSARLEYGFTDATHGYAGFSRGGETQQFQGVTTTEITTDVTAGVTFQLDPRWGLRFDYMFEDRQDTYTRHTLGSAVTVRF